MKKILLFYVFCLVAWPMMAQDGDGASESEYGDSREEDLAAEGLAWPRNVQARIDRIVQDAKSLGIETKTPQELEVMLQSWQA